MRIQVLRDYAGRLTNERRIQPGVYELDADELFGVGQYLLDNGFAVALGEPVTDEEAAELPEAEVESFTVDSDNTDDTEPEADEPTDDDSDEVDYNLWTRAQLEEELEARGIDLPTEGSGANGNVLKDDLVLVLEGDDADDEEEE
jgi:hypothetical protein